MIPVPCYRMSPHQASVPYANLKLSGKCMLLENIKWQCVRFANHRVNQYYCKLRYLKITMDLA